MAINESNIYSYDVVGEKVDMSEIIGLVSPSETPLMNLFLDNASPVNSNTHLWLEDALIAQATTLGANFASDATSLTAADSGVIRSGDILQISEVIYSVSAISGDTLATVSSVGGGSRTDVSSGATITIESSPKEEGFTAATARWQARSSRTNYTQIFSEPVEVTGTEMAISQGGGNYGVDDEYEYQVDLRLRELGINVEKAVLSQVTPRAAATSTPGLMGGIGSWLNQGGNTVSTAANLTEDILNDAIQMAWSDGGNPDLIVCGGTLKRSVSGLYSDRIQSAVDERMGGVRIDRIITEFGELSVLLHRWMASGEIFIMDSSRIKLKPLTKRGFFHELLAKTGDSKKGQLVGEYTLEYRNPETGVKIYGLTG
jgi:hypothetical protein